MKKLFCLLALIVIGLNAHCQSKEISSDWTSFSQSIDASFVKKKLKFKMSASVKVVAEDTAAYASLWARVDKKNGETDQFKTSDQFKSPEWKTGTVEGEVDEHSDKIFFGGYGVLNGKFFFDNVEFFIQNDAGKFEKVNLENLSFEKPITNNKIPDWLEGTKDRVVRVKEYTLTSSNDHVHGRHSLLMEGKGIKSDSTYFIGPREGFTPQIGTMISMLNNLSNRVEKTVELLNQEEIDWLLDDKANSIGALIMHLAAAEVYYQIFTFENRQKFNEEEEKKWGVALELGEEARKMFKGHTVDYYLDIYKEVRQKTITELRKRNDEWLEKTYPGYDMNNHFCWFHVMEHQSSHLGQILLLKKRIPKKNVVKIPEEKIDHGH